MSIQNVNIDGTYWDKYIKIFSPHKDDKRIRLFLNTWFKYICKKNDFSKATLLYRISRGDIPAQLKNCNFKDKFSNLADDDIHPEWFKFFISVIHHITSKKDDNSYKQEVKEIILKIKDSEVVGDKFMFSLLSYFFTFSDNRYSCITDVWKECNKQLINHPYNIDTNDLGLPEPTDYTDLSQKYIKYSEHIIHLVALYPYGTQFDSHVLETWFNNDIIEGYDIVTDCSKLNSNINIYINDNSIYNFFNICNNSFINNNLPYNSLLQTLRDTHKDVTTPINSYDRNILLAKFIFNSFGINMCSDDKLFKEILWDIPKDICEQRIMPDIFPNGEDIKNDPYLGHQSADINSDAQVDQLVQAFTIGLIVACREFHYIGRTEAELASGTYKYKAGTPEYIAYNLYRNTVLEAIKQPPTLRDRALEANALADAAAGGVVVRYTGDFQGKENSYLSQHYIHQKRACRRNTAAVGRAFATQPDPLFNTHGNLIEGTLINPVCDLSILHFPASENASLVFNPPITFVARVGAALPPVINYRGAMINPPPLVNKTCRNVAGVAPFIYPKPNARPKSPIPKNLEIIIDFLNNYNGYDPTIRIISDTYKYITKFLYDRFETATGKACDDIVGATNHTNNNMPYLYDYNNIHYGLKKYWIDQSSLPPNVDHFDGDNKLYNISRGLNAPENSLFPYYFDPGYIAATAAEMAGKGIIDAERNNANMLTLTNVTIFDPRTKKYKEIPKLNEPTPHCINAYQYNDEDDAAVQINKHYKNFKDYCQYIVHDCAEDGYNKKDLQFNNKLLGLTIGASVANYATSIFSLFEFLTDYSTYPHRADQLSKVINKLDPKLSKLLFNIKLGSYLPKANITDPTLRSLVPAAPAGGLDSDYPGHQLGNYGGGVRVPGALGPARDPHAISIPLFDILPRFDVAIDGTELVNGPAAHIGYITKSQINLDKLNYNFGKLNPIVFKMDGDWNLHKERFDKDDAPYEWNWNTNNRPVRYKPNPNNTIRHKLEFESILPKFPIFEVSYYDKFMEIIKSNIKDKTKLTDEKSKKLLKYIDNICSKSNNELDEWIYSWEDLFNKLSKNILKDKKLRFSYELDKLWPDLEDDLVIKIEAKETISETFPFDKQINVNNDPILLYREFDGRIYRKDGNNKIHLNKGSDEYIKLFKAEQDCYTSQLQNDGDNTDNCGDYFQICLGGSPDVINKCKQFLISTDFWKKVPSTVETMLPTVIEKIVNSYEFPRFTTFDKKYKMKLIQLHPIEEWYAFLKDKSNKNPDELSNDELEKIVNNDRLKALLVLIIDRVNKEPAILNSNFVEKQVTKKTTGQPYFVPNFNFEQTGNSLPALKNFIIRSSSGTFKILQGMQTNMGSMRVGMRGGDSLNTVFGYLDEIHDIKIVNNGPIFMGLYDNLKTKLNNINKDIASEDNDTIKKLLYNYSQYESQINRALNTLRLFIENISINHNEEDSKEEKNNVYTFKRLKEAVDKMTSNYNKYIGKQSNLFNIYEAISSGI